MRVDQLFTVSYGHSLELNRLTKSDAPDAVNFVSRTAKNNGVSARVRPVDGETPAPAGTLSVALGGSVIETFLQPSPYLCGRDVAILTPKEPMTDVELLWWASCVKANRFRYNYGRQANRTLAGLQLPDDVPDWVHEQEVPELAVPTGALPGVDASSWKPFRWADLFDIKRGVYVPAKDQRPGTTPVVTSTAQNNGRSKFLDREPTHPAGVLTVARNGSVGETFFQAVPFFASDDIHILYPKAFTLDARRGMFIAALIKLEKYRYNYGRKWSVERMKDSVLRLPVTSDNAIDWSWIDDFMSRLPYSDAA